MACATGHRIFGRDDVLDAFGGKSLITFIETKNKNEKYLFTQNFIALSRHCSLHENSSDWCTWFTLSERRIYPSAKDIDLRNKYALQL